MQPVLGHPQWWYITLFRAPLEHADAPANAYGLPTAPTGLATAILAEQVLLALLAAAAGLAIGQATAPLLTSPSAGLVGAAGAASLTATTIALVAATALAVAAASTFIPAIRAARSSTIGALAGSARPLRRRGWVVAASALLPVPLLLGLRQAARRPRRVVLAVVNAILITWATVLDARRPSALARAGRQRRAGQRRAVRSAADPRRARRTGRRAGRRRDLRRRQQRAVLADPPSAWLAAVVAGTLVAMAMFTAIPVLASTRRPASEILQSEPT